MTAHWERLQLHDRVTRGNARRLAAVACALLLSVSAAAQDAQPQRPGEPAAEAPAAPPRDPAFRPGFLDAVGRWIGDSKAALDSRLRNTQEALGGLRGQADDATKQAADAAQQAAGAIVGLPAARIVTGRERCAVAPNGAPDCRTAADGLCRGKGFKAGQGVEVNSAQKCPAWVWFSGRGPSESDCSVETFVTRAVCQ